jgi:hypothetical protein
MEKLAGIAGRCRVDAVVATVMPYLQFLTFDFNRPVLRVRQLGVQAKRKPLQKW